MCSLGSFASSLLQEVMDDYDSSVIRSLIGIVSIKTSALVFPNDITTLDPSELAFDMHDVECIEGRLLDTEITKNLAADALYTVGCSQNDLLNQIPALISALELEQILESSSLTKRGIHNANCIAEYPKLCTGNKKIYCLQGQHRIKAAENVPGSGDNWWTIRLYCFVNKLYMTIFQREKIDQYSYEARPSDGTVYRKVCFYENDDFWKEIWTKRLTEPKQKSLRAIESDVDLSNALKRLIIFPGLWDGSIKLGNWRKHIALNVRDFILHSLGQLFDVWNEATLESEIVRRALNIDTVRMLQYRAPSMSKLDRSFIVTNMDEGKLFPSLMDRAIRESVKEALLGLKVIIPTFKSFNEKMKYLEIGVKAIKEILNPRIPPSLRVKKKERPTLYELMRMNWCAPEAAIVEFGEGDFRVVTADYEALFHLCFLGIFYAVLRHFPYLSSYSPRKDSQKQEAIKGALDQSYRLHILKRAWLWGFKHEDVTTVDPLDETMKMYHKHYPLNPDGETLERRCGRPFITQFEQLRTRLFLPILSQPMLDESESSNPSLIFIAQDFMKAFFPPARANFASAQLLTPTSHAQTAAFGDGTSDILIMSPSLSPLCDDTTGPVPCVDNSEAREGSPENYEESPTRELPTVTPLEIESETSASKAPSELDDNSNSAGLAQLRSLSQEQEYESGQKITSLETFQEHLGATYRGPFEVGSPDTIDTSTSPEPASTLASPGTASFLVSPRMEDLSTRPGQVAMCTIQFHDSAMLDTMGAGAEDILVEGTLEAPPARLGSQSSSGAGFDADDDNEGSDDNNWISYSVENKAIYASVDSNPGARQTSSLNFDSESCRSVLQPEFTIEAKKGADEAEKDADEAENDADEAKKAGEVAGASEAGGIDNADVDTVSITKITDFYRDSSSRSVLTPYYSKSPDNWKVPDSHYVASDSDSCRSVLLPQYVAHHQSRFSATDERGYFSDDSMSCRSVLPVEYTDSAIGRPMQDSSSATCLKREGSLPYQFKFSEFNGMRTLSRSTNDMDQYLKHRRQWQGIVVKNGVSKTMRFEDITKHMINGSQNCYQEYVLFKLPNNSCGNSIKNKRYAEISNETGLQAIHCDKRRKKS